MDWKANLSEADLKILENRGSRDFARVARAALTFGLFHAAKQGMTREEAESFDAYRRQRTLQSIHRHTGGVEAEQEGWFEQIENKIAELVDNAVLYADDHTGGYGQKGTIFVEKKLVELRSSLQRWWNG
jgi:hypothetical protein